MIGNPESPRYATGSILLHWVIAALIVANITLGVIGRDAHPPEKFAILGYHKSIGLTILLLSLLRLIWRLLHRPPAYPATMPRWEQILARAVQAGFYVIMIGLPLTGWIAVTTLSTAPPIRYFGIVTWPFFPLLRSLAPGDLVRLHLSVALGHSILGKITLALLALHLAGAFKHMVSRDGIVWRIMPIGIFLPRRLDRQEIKMPDIGDMG